MSDEFISKLIENQKKIIDNISLSDYSPHFFIKHNDMEEWWRCDEHFMVKDHILYLLNERKEKKVNWISFSTGKIVRPEIITI